mmetsp:Transcript_28483/g.75410  ORF Transcript_28483/g.75410 Transcript_28483/m.75410 type:complete len:278 (-) Transcript_28483:3293-4126(-)
MSRSFWSRSDSTRDSVMVVAAAFVPSRDLMSGSFSRMFPLASASDSSSCFSRSASSTFRASSFCSSSDFRCSSSGFSCLSVAPRSWPSRPARVTEKFTRVTRHEALGGRLSMALEFLVHRYILKPSLKSHIFSPICTTCRGPCRMRSFRRSGKRKLSMPSTSWMMRVFPKRTASSSCEASLGSCWSTTSEFLACCFSHSMAWLLGSTMKGTMHPYLIMTAFSCERRSAERPWAFHVSSSLSLDMTLRKSKFSMPRCFVHSICAFIRTSSGKWPRYVQ